MSLLSNGLRTSLAARVLARGAARAALPVSIQSRGHFGVASEQISPLAGKPTATEVALARPAVHQLIGIVRRSFSSAALPAGVTYLPLPALSPTMEQGNVAKWHKAVGDAIKPGDVICEVQTDKAVVAFEAQEEGILGAILVTDDQATLTVGAPIGLLVEEASQLPAAAEFAKTFAAGGAAPAAAAGTPAPAPAPAAAASPAASSASAAPSSSSSSSASTAGPVYAQPQAFSPAVAHLLANEGLDPASIKPSGVKSRLLKGDIILALEAGTARKLPPGAAHSHGAHAAAAPAAAASAAAASAKPAAVSTGKSGAGAGAGAGAKPAAAVAGMSARRAAARTATDSALSTEAAAAGAAFTALKRAVPHTYFRITANADALIAVAKQSEPVPAKGAAATSSSTSSSSPSSSAPSVLDRLLERSVKSALSATLPEVAALGLDKALRVHVLSSAAGAPAANAAVAFELETMATPAEVVSVVVSAPAPVVVMATAESKPSVVRQVSVACSVNSALVDDLQAAAFLQRLQQAIEAPALLLA